MTDDEVIEIAEEVLEKAAVYGTPDVNSFQVGGSHYQGEYTQQHWDYCWERRFDPFQYVITKYVERHRRKNGLEDLEKAQHYLAKYIDLLKIEKARMDAAQTAAAPAATTGAATASEPILERLAKGH